jgi:hypothetical protein
MAPARVAELLVASGVRLDELISARTTLEDAYFTLTRDAAAHAAERTPA